jgi:hypothetical protein
MIMWQQYHDNMIEVSWYHTITISSFLNDVPESSSTGVLETRWSKLVAGKSCSWVKSRAKAHAEGRRFYKVQCQKTTFKLKINNAE